jgi:hypothetical protein
MHRSFLSRPEAAEYICTRGLIVSKNKRQIWHPLLIRRCVDWQFLYSPHKRPQDNPETLEFLLVVVRVNGLEAEIIRRWRLSEEGRLPHHVWGQNWTWP